jgi:hypothetical protein
VPVKLTNNAYSQIPQAVGPADTSITVAAGSGAVFPDLGDDDWFFATIISVSNYFEIVKVVARVDDTFTVERGAEDTTPLSFPANSRIELRVTTGNVDIMQQNVLLL